MTTSTAIKKNKKLKTMNYTLTLVKTHDHKLLFRLITTAR